MTPWRSLFSVVSLFALSSSRAEAESRPSTIAELATGRGEPLKDVPKVQEGDGRSVASGSGAVSRDSVHLERMKQRAGSWYVLHHREAC
jgi:hypothetical protein